MSITTIQAGSIAKSSTLNNNFLDLQNQISTVSASTSLLANSIAEVNANLSTLSSTVVSNNLNAFQLNENNTISGSNLFTADVTFSANVSRPWADSPPVNSSTSSASHILPAVVVENYVNNSSWYRIFSDGWIMQGGVATANNTVTLLKSYSSDSYSVQATFNRNMGDIYEDIGIYNKTPESFYASCTYSPTYSWFACGY